MCVPWPLAGWCVFLSACRDYCFCWGTVSYPQASHDCFFLLRYCVLSSRLPWPPFSTASSPFQLQTVPAFVYGVLETTVVARVYSQHSTPRSENLHVKGFCLCGVLISFLWWSYSLDLVAWKFLHSWLKRSCVDPWTEPLTEHNIPDLFLLWWCAIFKGKFGTRYAFYLLFLVFISEFTIRLFYWLSSV